MNGGCCGCGAAATHGGGTTHGGICIGGICIGGICIGGICIGGICIGQVCSTAGAAWWGTCGVALAAWRERARAACLRSLATDSRQNATFRQRVMSEFDGGPSPPPKNCGTENCAAGVGCW